MKSEISLILPCLNEKKREKKMRIIYFHIYYRVVIIILCWEDSIQSDAMSCFIIELKQLMYCNHTQELLIFPFIIGLIQSLNLI